MTQVRHRKEPKIRASDKRKSVSHLESEETTSMKSNTLGHLRESLAQTNSGTSLDSNLRSELEPQFGHSFENVRVHSDTQADQMAKSINANAFTTGQDVYFREGMFKPESGEGKKLLAHELTHTIQQSRGTSIGDARVSISQPDDALEQAAHAQANAVMEARGTPVQGVSSVQGVIQRDIHDPSGTSPTTPGEHEQTETTTGTTASSSTPSSLTPSSSTPSDQAQADLEPPVSVAQGQAEFQSATRAYQAGHYLVAAHAFEHLAQVFPADQSIFFHNACRAYQHLVQGRDLGARQLNREIENALSDPANREHAQRAASEAIQAFQTHQYARASQLFLEAYQAVPSPEMQFNAGVALLSGGHPADALEAFAAARQGGVHVPGRLIRQAEEARNRTQDISQRDLAALSGSEADAIEAIVTEASLDDAGALFQTASRSFMDGRYDDAIHQFQSVQTVMTNTRGRPDVYLLWDEAQARFRAGDYAAALPLYRQSLSLH